MSDRDDLDAIVRVRANVPAIEPAALDAARTQLLDRIDEPGLAVAARKRHWGPALAAAAAVAALAAGAAALSATSARDARHGRAVADPVSSPVALSTSARAAAADQFLHVTTRSWAVSEASLKNRTIWFASQSRAEQWVPADWTQTWYWRTAYNTAHRFFSDDDAAYVRANNPELIAPGGDSSDGKDGVPADEAPPVITCASGCDFAPGWDDMTADWVARLPIDPTALRASLYAAAQRLSDEANHYNKTDDVDSQAFEYIGDALSLGYLPYELQGALYQVAATIPGVTVVGSETNLDGVHGVGLSRLDSLGDARSDLIFATPGGRYLGSREVVVSADWRDNHGSTGESPVPTTTIPVGTVISESAVAVDTTGAPSQSP